MRFQIQTTEDQLHERWEDRQIQTAGCLQFIIGPFAVGVVDLSTKYDFDYGEYLWVAFLFSVLARIGMTLLVSNSTGLKVCSLIIGASMLWLLWFFCPDWVR